MEGVKDFLQSSNIHGLVYLSTTRRLVRLLWLCVVITGFTGAGVLIYQSFSSWAVSPVSTTIETLPITELNFPNVTVCPPRNTFTSLNPDLVMARNVNFDEEKRKKLSDFVTDAVLEAKYNSRYSELMAYKQENYMNWYKGISTIEVPHSHGIYKMYNLETTKLSGSFSTPFFRQPFDENTFQKKLESNIWIQIHVPELKERSLVLDIEYEMEEISDYERIKIYIEYEDYDTDGSRTIYKTDDEQTEELDVTKSKARQEYSMQILFPGCNIDWRVFYF